LIDGMDHLAGFCCVLCDHSRFARAGPSLPSRRVLEAVSLALGYAELLERMRDPALARVARRALALSAR
jgi:hypothetical protein